MKKEIQIKRQNDSTYLTDLVLMHQEIFEDTELYGKLIYFDIAFRNYFKSVLKNKGHYVYGIFAENKIQGFIHFRTFDNVLFLNNIFLSKYIRGNGIGTYVLNKVLNMSFVSENNFKQLTLDVLESNFRAKKWYEKIGLLQESIESWYYVKKSIPKINNDLKLIYDDNQFKSIFLNNVKVATVINESCIIIHNFEALDFQSEFPFILKTKENYVKNDVQFSKFDSSVRMTGEISTVLKNTNNA